MSLKVLIRSLGGCIGLIRSADFARLFCAQKGCIERLDLACLLLYQDDEREAGASSTGVLSYGSPDE